MIRYGNAPYLECSSKGDKRFSAFYAKIKKRDNRSIEDLYQAFKIFEDGSTNLSWKEAKGKKPVNIKECSSFYSQLWDEYILENKHLISVLKDASGVSDIFGQQGHQCQATELWRIRKGILLAKKYNSKYYRFTGIARYMKLYEPDQYEETGIKKWKAPIYVDSKTKEKIKASGCQLKFKDDDGSNPNTEPGEFITFNRPTEYNFPSGLTQFAPPTVYAKDGKKLVWYEQDEDGDWERHGEPILVGNGSKVEVTVEIYATKRFGKGTRLVSVKILDLVEYIPPDDSDDDEQDSETPFDTDDNNGSEVEKEVKSEPVKRGKKISW